MVSMFISLSSRAAPLPLCAAIPLDSRTVAAASLAALFVRRRTVVPFPFLTVAMSKKNLLAKNPESNVPVYGYPVHGARPRGVVGGDHSFLSSRAPDRRSVFSASRRSANASSRPLSRYNTTVCRATDHGVENRGKEHSKKGHANHAENTTVPRACLISAPAPVAMISGITPKMNAKL